MAPRWPWPRGGCWSPGAPSTGPAATCSNLSPRPTRLATGQDFEVELVDANGQLPDQVRIHYWFDGEESAAVETHVMQPLGQKLAHRLNSVSRSFPLSRNRRR